ncbi:MAG TPA: 16S rRNA (guanine(527)-N(7))-methyltransferase RsmG [Thermomicrobiales bacterium]|nr:16S rRNA (guanine(527)-N(7))-methyltransferase RsmG [Thermomicrobiales bacterium]
MTACWDGVTLEQREQLGAYRDLLLDSNRKFNLTALREADSIDNRLIAESLRLLPFLPPPLVIQSPVILSRSEGSLVADNQPQRRHAAPNDVMIRTQLPTLRAVDIGSGAGIPGIPLAIARPDIDFTLIEATGKKVRFLELVASAIGLGNVTPLHQRAEIAAHDPALREQNDLVVARAVTQLAALAELTLPFLKIGGRALLPKGEQLDDELNRAYTAIDLLGGTLVSADLLPPISCCGVTRLVILDKIGPSIVRYPRRPGIPEHDPLGG